jgi:hypothetical protein
MINEYGIFGGIRIGRGNVRTLRKSGPVPLCPSQISYDPIYGTRRQRLKV